MKPTAPVPVMIFGLVLAWFAPASADVVIPGMGSGAYDVPSVGGPGDKVDKAPVCDNRARPKITKVVPDPVRPGDKITITGENFGDKACFHTVSSAPIRSKSSFSTSTRQPSRRPPRISNPA